jgi:RNA polymerase sigma-70 factor, ECF subfamily
MPRGTRPPEDRVPATGGTGRERPHTVEEVGSPQMATSPRECPRLRPSPECFAETVSPLLGPMNALARRILRSEDLALDAVQEALLSLWREPEPPPNPRAWLVRAVVHRSLHLLRSRTRRRRHEGLACLRRREASDRDDPMLVAQGADVAGKMREAFSEIAPEYREVLMLRAVEELDYDAIARTLRIPIGTVRSRLNRSRRAFGAALRSILPEERP